MRNPIYVVAGNYSQAAYWAMENGLHHNQWRYIEEERQVRGLDSPHYVVTGTWYDRRDTMTILDSLRMARGIKVKLDP